MVDKESAANMKALHQELTEKLGDRVVFVKAKYNPQALVDLMNQVSDYLQTLHLQGSYSVGRDTVGEVIEIHAKLSDEQIDQLRSKFDSALLKITNEELHIVLE
ncbi:hypothetical protein [Paenibacillus sp. BK720]|uniref:hypothetical protein n=1 Tax=Paenibacillus sp. BK720 TaxID=2587092 RepID=UPI0014234431|nr:hypothetical protein [Paenibacillus sp. BK720]NIK70796.1 hypothetical protein [Paenibacillus sp. BK720]